jgi:hypothetical protein
VTEEEWLACENPTPMLLYLDSIGLGSERKLRLFSVACCRRLLSKVPVRPQSERAVEVAEHFADGLASDAELRHFCCYANNTAEHACREVAESESGIPSADCTAGNAAWAIAEYRALPPDHNGLSPVFNAKVRDEQSKQCHSLRDIFGNPFRPVAPDPAWLTSDVLALARGIYEEKAFDRMPILADALQDAGCDNEDVLSHCRDTQLAHVRGCWVVDQLLGKK